MVTKVPQRIIASTGVTIGSYTNSSITVNQSGQITSASSGSPQETTPKITSIQVTNSSYQILDDTAVDVLGGYIKITGTDFASSCQVIVNNVLATSTTFVSSTEVRAQLPATAAGTYVVYLVNTDGGVAIRVNGITFSATPSWVTASILNDGTVDTAISIQLAATSATTYQLQAGSTLPTGLSLSSGGLLSGTVTGIANDTTYSFTVVATDLENQDSPRTFSITIGVSDPYYRLTTLYLPGNSGATIVTDASTNNFPITVVGDSRASNFSPYLTGWSNYFGGGSYLAVSNAALALGTGDFSIILYLYTLGLSNTYITGTSNQTGSWAIYSGNSTSIDFRIDNLALQTLTGTISAYTWNKIEVRRTSGILYLFVNDVQQSYVANTTNFNQSNLGIGSFGQTGTYSYTGYISNLVITKAGVEVLNTCRSNRFIDTSPSPLTITANGSISVQSFSPFTETDITTGSAYFDGTGDYIVSTSSPNLAPGTGDFTLECWVYFTAVGSDPGILQIGPNAPGTNTPAYTNSIGIARGSGSGKGFFINNGTYTIGTSSVIPLYTWCHLAVARQGTTHRYFVNGILDGTVTDTTNYTGTYLFAGVAYGSNYPMTGYISNIRFIKGTAAYTANFALPTAPLTATANTQLLTLQNRQPHNNHSFQDSSTYNWLITRNGNPTQGSFSPFSQSGWSTLFNGSNGLSVPSNAALSFSGEFTFETFVYYNAIPGSGGAASFIMRRSNTASGSSFQFGLTNDTGQYKYFVSISVSSTDYNTNWNVSAPSVGRWYHVAVVRDNSSNMHCWLDGIKLTLSGGNSNIPGTTNVPSTDVTIGWRNYYNDLYLNGYLSNLRLSAAALYSGSTFTVPAQAFDPSQANTRLLICHTRRFVDQGSANLTIGFNYYPSVQAFSPFAPTAVYSPATHGGSAYFDGSTNAYLEMADNDAFVFGSGNFSLETWVYATSAVSTYHYVISKWRSAPGKEIIWGVGPGGAGKWGLLYTTDGGSDLSISDQAGVVAGQWYHFMVCRTGTTMSLYTNGIRTATKTEAGTLWNSSNPSTIGIHEQTRNEARWPGYISGLRSIRGSHLYDATQTTISIPTAPPTATSATSLLLNFTNGAIADATGRNVLETVGDARTISAVAKWAGSSSMYFDGTGDYLQMPDSELLELGSADFTIEAWIYPTLIAGANRPILGHGTSGSQWLAFYVDANGYVEFAAVASSTIIDRTATSRAVSLNTWTHVAVSRSGSTFRLFIDGSEPTYTGSPSSSSSAMPNFATPFRIGAQRWDGDSGIFQGYMQDLRITRGYARYTANFTPPTGSFKLR